jgi:hypothetical protein
MTEPMRDTAEPETGDPEHRDPDASSPGMPPPTAIESLVNAMFEAGPEVAEHVVRAAQELLLAAQTVVDAAEKAIREQQELRRSDGATDGSDARRHLDLAE